MPLNLVNDKARILSDRLFRSILGGAKEPLVHGFYFYIGYWASPLVGNKKVKSLWIINYNDENSSGFMVDPIAYWL